MSEHQQRDEGSTAGKWLKRLVFSLVCLFLAVAIPASILELIGRSALREQVKRLRDAGEPLTWEELLSRRKPLLDEQNSFRVLAPLESELGSIADILGQASDLPICGREPLPPLGHLWSAQVLNGIRELIARYDDVLAKLDHMRAYPRGQRPIGAAANPLDLIPPNMESYRAASRLEALAAIRDLAEGDVDSAVGRCEIMLCIRGAISDEPVLISILIASAVEELAIETLEHALAGGQAGRSRLVDIGDRLRGWHAGDDIINALRGERAFQYALLENARIHGWDTIMTPGSTRKIPPRGFNIVYRVLSGLVRLNQARMLEIWHDPINASGDLHKLVVALKQIEAVIPKQPTQYFLVESLMPSISGAVQFVAFGRTRTECARAAIAAELYRIDHGRWPETLNELVPLYLDAVPIDPLCGKQLRYRILDDRITVYSVGVDGVDDGGNLEDSLDRVASPDIGFRLLNPDRRGFHVSDPEPPAPGDTTQSP